MRNVGEILVVPTFNYFFAGISGLNISAVDMALEE